MRKPNFLALAGDCFERMRELKPGSIDLVLADPPYGTTECKWDSVLPLAPMWTALRRVLKPGAPVVLFSQQPFTTALAASNLKQLRTEWIWEKRNATGFLNARLYPLKAHENVLVFCERLPPYFPQFGTGRPYRTTTKLGAFSEVYGRPCVGSENTTGTRFPRSVVKPVGAVVTGGKRMHPTQKPVDLCEYLIRTYTTEGQTVLDFCMGSGSTGVAALNARRRFIGIERDAKYFAIAEQRLQEAADGNRLAA